jgi:MoxR-like ATPase
VKYLSIALPDRIIPLFPFDGDKGKRAAFKALPLGVEPASFNHLSRGERQIHSNDVLLEKVAPLLSEDMWEIQRFLWWATRQYEALEAAAEGDEDAVTTLAASAGPAPDTRSARGSVTLADVAARTLMDPEWLTEIANALRSDQPHVILAGPPGTSKTFLADHMASHLTGGVDRAITTVQLHPSYGYEEFVEGLRPTTGDNGELRFVPEPGPLLRVAEAARRDADSLQVLIVDEMNRANLPRVFGELLFLLEYRDRSLDLRFHPGFSLPENVALIGTMNTADRSIRSIDAAIRRRFEIFECMPDPALLERWFASERGVSHVPDLREGFERLNGRLTELLDRHHTVGHSFLMRQELTSDMLRRIWARRIGPLVEEYLFDRPDTAREITLEWCWPSQAAARR